MKFVIDPMIDYKRRTLKEEYDEIFNKIRASVKGSKQHSELLVKEAKAHKETQKFLENHRLYFSNKRIQIFKYIEAHGIFGNRPKFEEHQEWKVFNLARRAQSVTRIKKCPECGDKYVWRESFPQLMCFVCRKKEEKQYAV